MRPLICPQCGGKITDYQPGATFTDCEYCSTRFLIEPNKQPRTPPAPVEPPGLDAGPPLPSFVKVLGIVMGAIAVIAVFAIVVTKSSRRDSEPGSSSSLFRSSSTRTPSPSPTPDRALLRFGTQGFSDDELGTSCAIAVDKDGSIYVGDTKLRVQQFDASGGIVRTLKVPAKGRNYERARAIDKIAIGGDGKLYVAIGGVILIYGPDWKSPQRVVQVAPNYIQDFVVKSDGSMLAVADDDELETLLFVNKSGGITKRLRGFHYDAIEAQIAPLETATESVRIAVDSGGSIYSVYALGDLGSYSLSIGDTDLRIAKFSPDGKFEKAFAAARDSQGLAIDNTGRLIATDRNSINAYTPDGTLTTFLNVASLDEFALDPAGHIYTLADNTVAKWKLDE